MRFRIIVATQVNEQPKHEHVRYERVKFGKVEQVFNETVQEEYDRLSRGLTDDTFIDGFVGGEFDVTMYLVKPEGISTSRVYAKQL